MVTEVPLVPEVAESDMIDGAAELLPEFEPDPLPDPDEPEPDVLPDPEPESLPDPDPLPDPEVKVYWSRLSVADVPAVETTVISTVPVTPYGATAEIVFASVTVYMAATLPK